MKLLDARRLTGPSLLFDEPAAVLDVACDQQHALAFVRLWRTEVERMLLALGWPAARYSHRILVGGVSAAFAAPIDALYAATEINEWAFATVAARLEQRLPPPFEDAVAAIASAACDERNESLRRLQQRARAAKTSLLWDDDRVSLGMGAYSATWPARELPDPDALDWSYFNDIPLGIVTGTNGKTTTVRLAAHILKGAGRNVGLSSTDWIAVDGQVLDRGDWSGPGGARAVLRQPTVDTAILESARGGLLRRGLGVQQADCALITNIAEDHLGDFGSGSTAELLDIKWIVSRAVRHSGSLILNADDGMLREKAKSYPGAVTWFGLEPRNPVVSRHLESGGTAFVLEDASLVWRQGSACFKICAAREIPITLDGAARHNIANALAAAALAASLGASMESIRHGLVSMSQNENPGRCNIYAVGQRTVLVDFAHNPHAMQALFQMAEALPAKRRALCFGQAGDRPDSLIREMTRDAFAIGLDKVFISELSAYHRGRQCGEVYRVIRDELLRLGLRGTQIEHRELEAESLSAALEWAQDHDLVIMLALGGAAPIQAQIEDIIRATE